MEKITHSQIQELIDKLPAQKLPLVYNILTDLLSKQESDFSPQVKAMFLPIHERRKILSKQAEQIAVFYKESESERQLWQAGDFTDEH